MTICAVVDPGSGNPSDPQVRQEDHSNETVFAMKCHLTDASTRTENFGPPLSRSSIRNWTVLAGANGAYLLWRSASTSLVDVPDSSLASVLVESDVRKVTVAPRLPPQVHRPI